MQYHKEVLKNGIELITIPTPGSTCATVQIWFRAGSALEGKDNQGIAHFLEHMFFKGSKRRPNGQITQDVESFGGEINAFTSFDYTCYYINCPTPKLMESVDILLDMVCNPIFKKDEIIPEQGVVIEEYRRSQDSPSQYSFQKFQKSCFGAGYSHPILGNQASIQKFNLQKIKNFRSNHYNKHNCFLVIGGDIKKPVELKKAIEKFKLPVGPKSKFPNFKLRPKVTFDLHQKEVRMASLTIALEATGHDQNGAEAEDLAMSCLGHGESSRLNRRIISGLDLANSSSASTMFLNDGGVHFISFNFPLENFDKLLSEVHSEFESILQKGFDKSEIKKIQNHYISSKIYDNESIESYSFSIGHSYAISGDLSSEEQYLRRVADCRVPQVNDAFRKIFARSLHFSLQLPVDTPQEKFQESLAKLAEKINKIDTHKTVSTKIKVLASVKEDPAVKLINLKPGINLLYRKNSITPTFILQTYLRGGVSEESLQTNGSYHILSSLLTSANKKLSHDDLKHFFEDRSASFSSFSGRNAYGLNLHGKVEDFYDLSEQYFDCLLHPQMPDKFFKQEISLAQRTLEHQKEDTVRQCFNQVHETFFPNHPYRFQVIGTEDSLPKIERKDLLDLHSNNLTSKDMLITFCGDMDLPEVYTYLQQQLVKMPARKSHSKKADATAGYSARNQENFFEREQTQIFIGIPIKSMEHTENIYLKMLSAFLSGQSSELFVEVRDRQGLCYSVQPIHFTALEGGYWGIYMASGKDKVDEAIKAITVLLDKYQDGKISKKEFNGIKTMIRGQNLVNIQTNEDYANIYSIPCLNNLGLSYFHKNNDTIQKMSYEDFTKNIQRILGRKKSMIIVGPREKMKS